jgi:hypothetical protein
MDAPCAIQRSALSGDESAGEVRGVERAKIFELLPHADQLHRQAELVRDRHRDAALRRAVELRQRDAGDAGGLAEEARLLEPVLAGRGVDDEQGLERRAFELGLPVKLIGVGEGLDDLRPFDPLDFARALVSG